MTDQGAALETALAYHRAWTTGDFEQAMTYVADDIRCVAPAGRLEGAEAFRSFMAPFAQLLISAELLAAFGDATTAMVMYDTHSVAVSDAPAAELVRVVDGRIVELRIIFDRVPFDAARRGRVLPTEV
jgi:ketosteroid isomerase-like protein